MILGVTVEYCTRTKVRKNRAKVWYHKSGYLMQKKILALVVGALAIDGYAHEEATCQKISNQLDRLTCYDQAHSEDSSVGKKSKENDKLTISQGSNGEQNLPARTYELHSEDSGIFDHEQDGGYIKSTVKSYRKGPNAKLRFYLTNEQIWESASTRGTPVSSGAKIEIKRGTVGGHFASIEDGQWIRVKRVD
jgi:hypothetical protein